LCSVTISNANRFNERSQSDILLLIEKEINRILKTEINVLGSRMFNVRNGTPLITNKNNHLRPKVQTGIKNLFLAGDWIDTCLPPTIEGAAISGRIVADSVKLLFH